MKTKIFYFSITGNSLFVARVIAKGLGDTEIIPIPRVISRPNQPDEERVGIIFPVYAWGPPRIVTDFVNKLRLNKNQYVFSIATCRSMPGGTLIKIKKLLNKKGSHLNAGFLLREDSRPDEASEMSIVKFIKKITNFKPVQLKTRNSEIMDILANNKNHMPEASSLLAQFLGNTFHKIAMKNYKTSALNYIITEKCNLCGICLKICPRENISIENGRIKWGNNCEGCNGCYQWCPEEAILLNNNLGIKSAYHHPMIRLEDIILR